MILGLLIQDGNNVLGVPLCFSGLLAVCVAAKGIHREWGLAALAIRRQSVHHVTQHRVVEAVPHEAHGVVSEQLADETRCPALDEIGQAEISTRHHQAVQFAVAWSGRQ
jgi:hypothetical protein